jgi:hypothetical protein
MTTEHQLVYAGRRLTVRDTLAYFYFSLSDGKLHGYKRPLASGLKVGTIVRIHEDGDSYYANGPLAPTAIGQFQDQEKLLHWSAAQEADVALHAQKAESKRIASAGIDPMREALDPVRDELASMTSVRRAAAIGWIITYLQTGQRR